MDPERESEERDSDDPAVLAAMHADPREQLEQQSGNSADKNNHRFNLLKRVGWWVAFAALFVVLIGLEASSFNGMTGPVYSGDEAVWSRVAEHSLFSREFYTDIRPFTVPLIHKLANSDDSVVVRIQSWVSIFAWFSLAIAVASLFKRPIVRLGVAVFICLFSLTWPINQWDYVIRSESFNLSFLALGMALTIGLIRNLQKGRSINVAFVLWWAIACLLLLFTRDSMVYTFGVLLLAFVIYFIYEWVRNGRKLPEKMPSWLLILALLAAMIGFSQWSFRNSIRWHTPLVNVILQRIMPQQDRYEHWLEHTTFPANPTFEQYAGMFAWDIAPEGGQIRSRLESDQNIADIQQWLTEEGTSSYSRYLVLNAPVQSITQAFQAMSENLNLFNEGYAQGAGNVAWSAPLSRLLFPSFNVPILIWVVTILVGVGIVIFARGYRLLGMIICFLILNAWIQAFITFHGDAAEIPRHMMIVGVLFRLSFWLAVITVIAIIIDRLRPSSKPVATSEVVSS
ncbi:MAG: hypothetical protein WAT23_07590 [Chromatiaceae bacterium]